MWIQEWHVALSISVCWIIGQLDQAATWLWENAEAMSIRSRADSDSGSHSAPPLSGVEVKAESVCICFIDDCLDCDVPLAELTFSREDYRLYCDTPYVKYTVGRQCFSSFSFPSQAFMFSRGLGLCRKARLVSLYLEIITTENSQVRSQHACYPGSQ